LGCRAATARSVDEPSRLNRFILHCMQPADAADFTIPGPVLPRLMRFYRNIRVRIQTYGNERIRYARYSIVSDA
jgi:hypothetical protein